MSTTDNTATADTIEFNVDSLTFREFVAIEEETGEPWSAFVQAWIDAKNDPTKQISARNLMLATWLMLRRQDDAVTLNDVRNMAFTTVWG